MVLRVRHSPARFPANVRYTPLDNTLLLSIPNGTGLLLFMHSDKSAWLLQVTSDKVPLSARNSSEVETIILTLEAADSAGVCVVAHPCRFDYPPRTNLWILHEPRLSAYYLVDIINLLPLFGIKKGARGSCYVA